jgi:hypothetical protein
MKMYIILIITIIISAIGAIYFKLEDDKKHLIKESTLEKKVIKYQGIIKVKDFKLKEIEKESIIKDIEIIKLEKNLEIQRDINEYQIKQLNKLLGINKKLTKFITKLKSDAKDTNKSN